MKINQNALQVLEQIMQERNWYNNQIERRKANGYKNLISKNKLSYEKASEILKLLGWQKVKEETWQKNNAHSMQA